MELVTTGPDGLPTFTPEAKGIKEFRKIIERDRGRKGDSDGRRKRRSTKELLFVHFYTHWKSRFEKLKGKERIDKVREAVDLPIGWEPDILVREACKVYRELIGTDSTDLVMSARGAARSLKNYFDQLPINQDGKLLVSPLDLIKQLQTVKEITVILEQLENELKTEEREQTTGKKGRIFAVAEKRQMFDEIIEEGSLGPIERKMIPERPITIAPIVEGSMSFDDLQDAG